MLSNITFYDVFVKTAYIGIFWFSQASTSGKSVCRYFTSVRRKGKEGRKESAGI